MRYILLTGWTGVIFLLAGFVPRFHYDHKTLEIGASAPDFQLVGVDDKTYNLASFKNAEVLVIVFTCNHCPTAQAYEDRLIKLTSDYANKSVAVVAINPNDPASLRLDELDFSDLGDSFQEMKIRAKEKNSISPICMTVKRKSHPKPTDQLPHRMFLFLIRTVSCVTKEGWMIWRIHSKHQRVQMPVMPLML